MKKIQVVKSRVRAIGKTAAYSSLGKGIARRLITAPADTPARKFIESKGLDGSIRRIASEGLPEDLFFAKLTIGRWQGHRGKPFRLLQGTTVVYGNEIEPPARGFPLEYRNIIVSSNDISKFTLDIDAPFQLAIGRGAFTTPQQIKYDQQYGVEQHNDVFYSLRGNTATPKKMLITFPGFGPSTSRISYAVSYLKAITDADLKDTLMVCFQDRYLAAGSYMMVDSAGRPLYDRVWSVLKELCEAHGIDESQMLFFGASKGGSIAIHYAQDFPRAQLLLGVPQMNLPYYFNKPFFRDNLFRNRALHELRQPEEILRQYFAEGRRIDYFYTNSDELSNHSLIELARDVPNLAKYRIDGVHSAVARAALPAMLGIIRQFLSGAAAETFKTSDLRTFAQDDFLQVQVRVDATASQVSGANWFLEAPLGRTRFLQAMSEHSYKFVKFTSESQRLLAAYDPIEEISKVVAIEASGKQWSSSIERTVRRDVDQGPSLQMTSDGLSLETQETLEYVVLDGDAFGRFRYRSRRADSFGDTMEVHVVTDIRDGVEETDPVAATGHNAAYVAVVESLDGTAFVDLLALRFVIAAEVPRLLVVLHGGVSTPQFVEVLANVDWADACIVVAVPGPIDGMDVQARPYEEWISSGRVLAEYNEAVASAP